jgi:hypothetical protein
MDFVLQSIKVNESVDFNVDLKYMIMMFLEIRWYQNSK